MQSEIRCERFVILQVLDREQSRAGLERGQDAETVGEALSGLEAAGLVVIDGERVRASEGLKRLDALGLIAV